MAIIIPGTGATGPIQTLTETVKNTSGGTLLKGTPVRITGATGQEANVGPADASTAFPANFVLTETLAPGESGQAVALGFINNVSVPNASLFTAGQEVWLAVGGGWTTTRPTGAANIQLLGNIVKVNTGTNTVSGIFAPQNIEYLPNLAQGKVWVGSAAGVPEESDPAFSGQIINGVAHFVSTTAPAFRTNAAGQNIGPLVAGDEWTKPTDGASPGTAGNWIWTGAYWVSAEPFWTGFSGGTYSAATINTAIQSVGADLVSPSAIYPMIGLTGQNLIWVEKWASWWFCNSSTSWTLDAGNSFEASAGIRAGSPTAWVTVNSTAQIGQTLQRKVCLAARVGVAINFQTVGDLHRPTLRVRRVNGTPSTTGNYFISTALDIRLIHP